MRVLARSIQPAGPLPYFHLGYLAAAVFTPILYGGLTLVLFSVLGANALKKWWRQSRLLAVLVAAICFAFGIFCFVGAYDSTRDDASGLATFNIARQLRNRLWMKEPIPDNMRTMQAAWGVSAAEIRDAWARELRLRKTNRDADVEYRVESAGRDGRFETADDIFTLVKGHEGGYTLTRWKVGRESD